MQVRAVLRVPLRVRAEGIAALPEITVPLLGCVEEVRFLRKVIGATAVDLFSQEGRHRSFARSAFAESANLQIEQPFRWLHNPRVKSGNLTGALPCAKEVLLKGVGTDQAAPSYTSISGDSPSRIHCNRR